MLFGPKEDPFVATAATDGQVRVHDLVLPRIVRAPKRSSALSKLPKNATEEDKEVAAVYLP